MPNARIAFVSSDWEAYDKAIDDGWTPDGSANISGVEVRYALLPDKYAELSEQLIAHQPDKPFEQILTDFVAEKEAAHEA